MRDAGSVSDVTIVPGPLLEFLRWVGVARRSYDETMDAWRTSCPRLSVWEDASIAGYVVLERVGDASVVVLTDEGRGIVEHAGSMPALRRT